MNLKQIDVRGRATVYTVVFDPTLDKRGRCIPPAEGIYEPPRIVLREWDEEVFLHEVLHALLDTFDAKRFGISEDREEQLVHHLSHGLFDLGWRYRDAPKPEDWSS